MHGAIDTAHLQVAHGRPPGSAIAGPGQPLPDAGRPSPASAGPGRATALAWVMVAALAAVLALAACPLMLSVFQDYDDEGYVLLSVREFLRGRPLYDAVFSQYGPFYYLAAWLLAVPGGVPVTHDAAALVTAGVWVACSLLAGVSVLRLTGSLALGAGIQLVTFAHLFDLTYEAGHPQGLALVLVMAAVCLASAGTGARSAACAGIGAVIGAALLTKVNVGVFLLLAFALTFAACTAGRLARAIVVVAGLATLALPTLLMREHLSDAWGRDYALVVTLSALPVVVLHWGPPGGELGPRDWAATALGGAVVAVLAGGFVLARGTSPEQLLDGVLLQHRHFAGTHFLPAPVADAGVAAAAAGAGLFLATALWRRRHPAAGLASVLGTARGLWAALVLFGSATGDIGSLLNYALPFAWLVAADAGQRPRPERFARLALASVTILHALVAYPVAGTQRVLATVLLVAGAGVSIGDVLGAAGRRWIRVGPRIRLLLEGLACVVVLAVAARSAATAREFYASRSSLNLPGAHRLRIDDAHRAAFQWLACNLREHADTFVTMPGINSLYLWAEEEPPTASNFTHWMTTFDARRQAEIVTAASKHPRLCAVRHRGHTVRWLRGQDIDRLPLVRFINEEFDTVGTFGAYEVRVRRGRGDTRLLYCVQPPLPRGEGPASAFWSPSVDLPAMPGRTLARVVLWAPAKRRILADTEAVLPEERLDIISETRTAVADLKSGPLDLATARRLWLHVPHPERLPRDQTLVLQLRDAGGTAFGAVPVLEP